MIVRVFVAVAISAIVGLLLAFAPAAAFAKHCPYVPRSPLTHITATKASCTTAQAVAVGWFTHTFRDQHRRKWTCRARYIDDTRVAATCRRGHATVAFRSAWAPEWL